MPRAVIAPGCHAGPRAPRHWAMVRIIARTAAHRRRYRRRGETAQAWGGPTPGPQRPGRVLAPRWPLVPPADGTPRCCRPAPEEAPPPGPPPGPPARRATLPGSAARVASAGSHWCARRQQKATAIIITTADWCGTTTAAAQHHTSRSSPFSTRFAKRYHAAPPTLRIRIVQSRSAYPRALFVACCLMSAHLPACPACASHHNPLVIASP